MKPIVLVSALVAFFLPTWGFSEDLGQPKALFSDVNVPTRFYCAPALELTELKGQLGLLAGGRAGILLDDTFGVGMGGYGLVAPNVDVTVGTAQKRIGVGYGGLILDYYLFPKEWLNFSLGVLIGAGGAGTADRMGIGMGMMGGGGALQSSFLLVEPQVHAFVNLTRFLSLGAGATYRFSNGPQMNGFTDTDFSGFSGSILLRFGWF